MNKLGFLIVVGTSIWVLIDAKSIGVEKGQIEGLGNMGPWGWFFACLLLWIGGFPFYLAKRSEYKKINEDDYSNSTEITSDQNPEKKCSNCGERVIKTDKYCSKCGKRVY